MDRLTKWIAVGFGTGYSRVMPGTVGSLLGVPLAWGLMQLETIWIQTVAALLLALAAVPLCGQAEKQMGGKDPQAIVADEFLTVPIVVIGLSHPFALISGFALHRLFDIVKPPPIRQLQGLHGGAGIVIDDFLAAGLALGANHLLMGWLV